MAGKSEVTGVVVSDRMEKSVVVAVERQVHQPEHVDGRQELGHRPDGPEEDAAVCVLGHDKRAEQDFVLREKS